MTDNNYPITPPPELVEQWRTAPEYTSGLKKLMMVTMTEQRFQEIAIHAARWGADQELDACCEHLTRCAAWEPEDVQEMRDLRRPKPKSKAEEALMALEKTMLLLMPVTGSKKVERLETIRAALERLRELEKTIAD